MRCSGGENEADFSNCSNIMERNFYMDDFFISVKIEKEAFQIFDELVKCLQRSGFNLEKWIINHDERMKRMSPHMQSDAQLKFYEVEQLHSSILELLSFTW